MGASVALGSPEGEHSNCPVALGRNSFNQTASRISCASYGVLHPVNFSAVKGAAYFFCGKFLLQFTEKSIIYLFAPPARGGGSSKRGAV